MVSGTILDFFTQKDLVDHKEVKFLVKDTDYNSTCCVRAKIPNVVLKELKKGLIIWWHNSTVFLEIYGVEDAKFEKLVFLAVILKHFTE